LSAPNLLRVALLTGYVDVARSLGLDVHARLKAVGLHRVNLSEFDALVPAEAVGELLERSAVKAGVEDFGLRMAARRSLAHLGPIGLIAREEPTIRDMIHSLARHFRLRTDRMILQLTEAEDIASIRLQFVVNTSGSIRQFRELSVAIAFRTVEELAGEAWQPEFISFAHPPPAKRIFHTNFFRTKVLFDNDFDGIVFPVRILDRPIPNADPMMSQFVRHYLQAANQPLVTIDAVVRQLAFALLPSGRCSSEAMARQLGIDRRTLSRRLEARGTTFSAIVDAARAELAGRHIRTERKSFTETAQLVGFSDLASFSRWFQRHFGMSATQWRKSEALAGNRLSARRPKTTVGRRSNRSAG